MNIISRRLTIDPEVSASELVESFVNGNKKDVINALKQDHPALTALFLYTAQGKLSESDINYIINTLIDDRMSLVN